MRIVVTVLFVGLALVFAPQLDAAGPVTTASCALPMGIVLAGLLSEGFTPLAVALGALGALAWVAIAPASLEAAGAVLVTAGSFARALRVRDRRTGGLAVLASLVTGALAATVATHYAMAPASERAAAALAAGIVATLALLIPADDVIAHTLARISLELPDPARATVLRAAMLRRRVEGSREDFALPAARRLEQAWHALVVATQARVGARGAGAAVLEGRVRAHLEALERLYAAADERLARVGGLDDAALTAARLEGDALEAEASALAEVVDTRATASE